MSRTKPRNIGNLAALRGLPAKTVGYDKDIQTASVEMPPHARPIAARSPNDTASEAPIAYADVIQSTKKDESRPTSLSLWRVL
jgi:hypothetical protein